MLGSIDVFVKQLNRIVKIHTALCRSWGVLNSVLTVYFYFYSCQKVSDRADILVSEIKTLCLSHLWQRIRFGASSTAAVAGYTCCLMWPLSSTLTCIQLHWSGVCSSAGVCTRGPLHGGLSLHIAIAGKSLFPFTLFLIHQNIRCILGQGYTIWNVKG